MGTCLSNCDNKPFNLHKPSVNSGYFEKIISGREEKFYCLLSRHNNFPTKKSHK